MPKKWPIPHAPAGSLDQSHMFLQKVDLSLSLPTEVLPIPSTPPTHLMNHTEILTNIIHSCRYSWPVSKVLVAGKTSLMCCRDVTVMYCEVLDFSGWSLGSSLSWITIVCMYSNNEGSGPVLPMLWWDTPALLLVSWWGTIYLSISISTSVSLRSSCGQPGASNFPHSNTWDQPGYQLWPSAMTHPTDMEPHACAANSVISLIWYCPDIGNPSSGWHRIVWLQLADFYNCVLNWFNVGHLNARWFAVILCPLANLHSF